MIVLYTGTPGSGKSLDVARQIMIKLKLGQNVIGNMIIRPDAIKKTRGKYYYVDTYEMNPFDFVRYAEEFHKKGKEHQTIIVIDECQTLFNSRDWQKPSIRAWNNFFQLHRHYGYDVYLITQFDRLIDRQLRALVETNRVHRKISNAGFKGQLMSALFLGRLFVCAEEWYPKHMPTGSYFFIYKKKYAEFYDSYAAFSTADGAARNDIAALFCSDQAGVCSVMSPQDERGEHRGPACSCGDDDLYTLYFREDDDSLVPMECPPVGAPLGHGNRLLGFLKSRGIIPLYPKGG